MEDTPKRKSIGYRQRKEISYRELDDLISTGKGEFISPSVHEALRIGSHITDNGFNDCLNLSPLELTERSPTC